MKFVISCDFSEVSFELFRFDQEIRNEVNSYLSDRKYGDGILEYTFLYRVYPEAMLAFEMYNQDSSKYYPRKKSILVTPFIRHGDFIRMNKTERVRLICSEILIAIQRFNELGVKNFDIKNFYTDLEDLFSQKGWL